MSAASAVQADILDGFHALYGDTTGYLHVGAGSGIHLKNGKPSVRRPW